MNNIYFYYNVYDNHNKNKQKLIFIIMSYDNHLNYELCS